MIALDVETSGLDPSLSSILSIGAIDTDNPKNRFYGECRVWSEGGIEAHISDEAIAINGFSREEITSTTSKQSEAELVAKFVAWASAQEGPQNQTILGQNSSFDRDFVQAACRRAGIAFPFTHRILDIHSLVWLHMAQQGQMPPVEHRHSRISLNFALRYCGLPEEQWPHNALTGALAHAEVFSRIAYTKNLVEEFKNAPIPFTYHA